MNVLTLLNFIKRFVLFEDHFLVAYILGSLSPELNSLMTFFNASNS